MYLNVHGAPALDIGGKGRPDLKRGVMSIRENRQKGERTSFAGVDHI